MKHLLIITSLIIYSLGLFAEEQPFEFKEENRVPDASYMPMGFDSNDNSGLVFEGMFPNACYKVGLTQYTIKQTQKEIYISDKVFFYEGVACARVVIPYVKEIYFGDLKKGTYKIFFKNAEDQPIFYGNLNVSEAKSGQIDDHLYAPVSETSFEAASENSPAILTLKGEMTNSCMAFDRTEVHYYPDSNSISILPIAKIKESKDCYTLDTPLSFEEKVAIQNVPEGRYLLHIRSLNGKAINRIVNL